MASNLASRCAQGTRARPREASPPPRGPRRLRAVNFTTCENKLQRLKVIPISRYTVVVFSDGSSHSQVCWKPSDVKRGTPKALTLALRQTPTEKLLSKNQLCECGSTPVLVQLQANGLVGAIHLRNIVRRGYIASCSRAGASNKPHTDRSCTY